MKKERVLAAGLMSALIVLVLIIDIASGINALIVGKLLMPGLLAALNFAALIACVKVIQIIKMA